MSIELKMPALSPTMEKGNLAKWLIAAGDVVRIGDLIAEVETDKATMEVEAVDEGRVTSLLVAEGTEDVPVGAVIAILSTEPATTEQAPVAPPVAAPPVATAPVAEAVAPADPGPAVAKIEAGPVVALARDAAVDATPLARAMAAALGIALTSVKGRADGRIGLAELGLPTRRTPPPPPLSAPAPASVAASAAPAPRPAPLVDIPHQVIKLTGMRKTIARRLTESKQTVPHFYLTVKCRLDELLALRGQLNASLAAHGEKLSVNDMLIKAMALAMRQVPEANVQFAGDEMYQFSRVDISMAVAIDGGLVTPVIRDVSVLSLSAIAQQSKVLAGRARDGKLSPEDYQGGTASISNLGMFGVDEMFPVINPPQALILGIGAGVEQPWKVEGQMALATVLAVTGSFDHRAIDGAVAARFMAAFRELVETPFKIAVS